MIVRSLPYLILLFLTINSHAQKYKKIYVNLYTDSLKKGTYNYINVDGLLTDGRYVPLDSNEIKFWASDGTFIGNSLFIDKDFNKDKVVIKIASKSQPDIINEFTMYVKKKADEKLKTTEELLEEMKGQKRKVKTKNII